MRLPIEWLGRYCTPGLSTEELAHRLTMTGTKDERILRHGVPDASGFVIGKVLSAEQHPDADRLRVCSVDTGDGGPRQIVCGAPNVAAGQTVAVALPGAVMPDGTKLGKAKLRGVESAGMILAEDEVAIGTEHGGIMVLADGPAPGTPLADLLPIGTDVIELEITPNRPDCLGVYGVAREVHAATGAPLGEPPWADDPGSEGPVEGVEITVECPELCPRFTARAFEGVRIGPSPEWLKARLMAAGQRPISNVVDVTNYVMLETGQPLHAFDLDRVAGGRLNVRTAHAGERMTTLDGVERELAPHMVLIEDADGPTSLAGVMGGERSEVSDGTTRVLMEVATWEGPNINRTSWDLGLRSEASARFEKQLAPEQAAEALAAATRLMLELTGATLVPGTVDVGDWRSTRFGEHRTILLREGRVESLLGVAIAKERCAEILSSLGFGVEVAADGVRAAVPHWRRFDVTREADLVEEVARIHGVDTLPATLPARRGASGLLTPEQRLRRRAEDALVGQGLHEIAGWSFMSPRTPARLRLPADDPRRARAVALDNPMSEEDALMRTALLPSLLDALARNVSHGHADVALFESSTVHAWPASPRQRPATPADEHHHLAALLLGAARPATWRDAKPPAADVFAAKGALAGVLDALRAPWEVRPGAEPFLHPGRSGRVLVAGEDVGWLGELHPLVAREWDLPGTAAGFEIDLHAVIARALAAERGYEDLTSFPAVRQDLAVVVGDDVAAADVLAAVRESGGSLLRAARVFDVYRGEQVGEGRVSLAVALEFRAADRTLTDEEASAAREAIVTALGERLGAQVRA